MLLSLRVCVCVCGGGGGVVVESALWYGCWFPLWFSNHLAEDEGAGCCTLTVFCTGLN